MTMSQKAHVQTPIFSRTRSASTSVTIPKDAERPDQVNLRIVQLEVAQKEACNVLKTLCSDAARKLHITDTVYEIDDILSGILVLGNLYKRVGNEKLELEKEIGKMKEEFSEYKRTKTSSIEHLEDVILKLQQENIKAQDTLTEVKLKHGQKLALAMKEISNSKEALEAAQQDYMKLEAKMNSQERKLMEMPRMEEQYLRNARGIVRQQEVANSFKEIGWKKLEEEVKSLNFWKNKAKSLEETVVKQKLQIDQLAGQSRTNLSKYQSVLQEFNVFKRANPKAQARAALQAAQKKAVSRNVVFNQLEEGSASAAASTKRPASAGAVASGARSSSIASRNKAASNIFGSGTYDRRADELAKLRTAVARKDEHITRLTRQLCYVRARPLMGMLDDGEAAEVMLQAVKQHQHRQQQLSLEHDDSATATASHSSAVFKPSGLSRTATLTGDGGLGGLFGTDTERMSLEELYQYYPDEDSQTDSFIAEERRREEARIDEALKIQQNFNGRIDRARAGNAPHIAAIRKAKSFAPGIAENDRG